MHVHPAERVCIARAHRRHVAQAFLSMHKIDELVLPLPYSQLLKIFSMFFVFSVRSGATHEAPNPSACRAQWCSSAHATAPCVRQVPFAMAPTVGIFTPFISVFLAAGYFGLDQAGAELERRTPHPFHHPLPYPNPFYHPLP